jgi:hypothetical protein
LSRAWDTIINFIDTATAHGRFIQLIIATFSFQFAAKRYQWRRISDIPNNCCKSTHNLLLSQQQQQRAAANEGLGANMFIK